MTPSSKPVIGLIGSIGAGKSAAAKALAVHGGFVIDADKLGHEAILRPGVVASIARRWGNGVLKPDGTVNRRALAGIVFTDEPARKDLEAIMFPAITQMMREQMTAAQSNTSVRFIVIDAPVLLEAGWKDVCDKLLFIDAPRAVRLARVKERNGWTDAELVAREAAQMPIEEKKALADAVIWNEGTLDDLQQAIDGVLTDWQLIETNAKVSHGG
jgi:dephospho-CoA kinase